MPDLTPIQVTEQNFKVVMDDCEIVDEAAREWGSYVLKNNLIYDNVKEYILKDMIVRLYCVYRELYDNFTHPSRN